MRETNVSKIVKKKIKLVAFARKLEQKRGSVSSMFREKEKNSLSSVSSEGATRCAGGIPAASGRQKFLLRAGTAPAQLRFQIKFEQKASIGTLEQIQQIFEARLGVRDSVEGKPAAKCDCVVIFKFFQYFSFS